jgi:fumarate reductase flavoprotein subunit
MSGNGLLQALIFGKIAGENAATEVRGQVVQDAPPASAEAAAESPAEQPATAYKDGEYTGTAKGYLADITVKVVVAEGVITSVEVTEQADTPAIYASAEEALLPAIVAQNGIGELKADSVTGATGSARGILDAIAAALEQAK